MAATTSGADYDDDAERRRRLRALLDATVPGRSLAVGRCKLALETFRSGGDRNGGAGGGLSEARTLLADALLCSNVHHPAIYRAWIGMELEARTDAAYVRDLFEGWRAWYLRRRGEDDGHGGERRPTQDEGGFWCAYVDFELRHGTAATARGVAERAVAACPRDPAVHAKYAKAELRLGCPDRARAVLLIAIDAFDADPKTQDWLEEDVTAYHECMHHGTWARLRRLFPSSLRSRRRLRPAQSYQLLAAA